MSKQELRDLISAVQTQNRSLVSLIDDFRRRRQELQKEIDALENQLTRSIRLPYLVASISEVFRILDIRKVRFSPCVLKMRRISVFLLKSRNTRKV